MRSSNRFLPACVLAVAMALSPTAKSQGVVVEQTSQKAVEKSLIKEIPTQYPKTMSSFNNEDGTVAFVLSDANLNTSEVELEGYWVNDMVVTKDSVFFCGVTTGENVVGIVGSFEIATFFAGTSGVNLWSNFLSGDKNYPVLELTRMVSYRNTYGERHAVCVGKVSDGYSCIVDMPIDATPGSIPGYMSGYINKANETLTDISTVHYRDSYYLVTGGFETTSGRYICLRLYDYDNVLYSGLQDVRYVFKIDTSYREWRDFGLLVSSVTDNVFSTASYRKQHAGIEAKGVTTLHIAFYQLSDFLAGTLSGMKKSLEFPMPSLLYRFRLEQFIVSPSRRTLGLLHTMLDIPYSDYLEADFTSFIVSVPVRTFRSTERILRGMGIFNSNTQYVMNGYKDPLPTSRMYRSMTFGGTAPCDEQVEYTKNEVDNVFAEKETVAFDVLGFRGNPVNADMTRKDSSLVRICE